MNAPVELTVQTRGLSKQTLTQAVCDELHAIAKACKGHLTPEAVLRNARNKRSPIHECFEWDDGVAAEKFRFVQASMLIRSVKVKVETHPQDPPQIVRAFVSVVTKPEVEGGGEEREDSGPITSYVPVETALKTEDYRRQMIENAYRELKAFQRKYSVLSELARVMEEIDRLAIAV